MRIIIEITYEFRLSNQLIQPLIGKMAIALLIDVGSVSGAQWLSIDQHAKPHGCS